MRFLRGLIAGGVRNPVLVNLLMVCILAGGLVSTRTMVREAFPEFSIDHLSVEVVYPGASPEDVERGVCAPIEDAIRGISGVRQVTSMATENYGIVWIGLQHDVRDPRRILDDVKERIDQIKTFPPETEKPVSKEIILRSEVISIAIYGEAEERTLKRYAQEVRDDLLNHPEISQVSLLGVREDEIIIEVSEEALLAHNLTITQLMGVVARSSFDLPAGVIRTAEEEVTLRITGQRFAAADYEDLVVIENPNAIVRLGDIATVREGFEEAVRWARFDGKPAAVVAVYKTPEEDSAAIAERVREYVAARQDWLPDQLHMTAWADTSRTIQTMLSMLTENGIQGIILVFLMLLTFQKLRYALWVAVGVLISFAGALIIMRMNGETLNLISVFALIIMAGIVVDDSIVIADSVHARRRAGDTPELAAINGTTRVAIPVLGASITTIAAFIPLLFVVGVMGKFIRVLPVVVIAAIVASIFEAFVFLPSHLSWHERPGVTVRERKPTRLRRASEAAIEHVITKWYRPCYRFVLNNRAIALSLFLCVLLITIGLVRGGHVNVVLLPKEDADMVSARVRLAEGSPARAVDRTIRRLREAAYKLNEDETLRPHADRPLVQHVFALAGEFTGWVGFRRSRGGNLCELRVELLPAELRRIDVGRIIERWRDHIGELHDAVEFTIERHKMGPTDRPVEIRLLGDDYEAMADASQRIQSKLREFAGLTDVHDDLVQGKREMQVRLRPAARALGLTLEDLATHLRHGFFGGEAVTLQRDRDQVKVRVRYPEDERRSIADLENERIPTLRGDEVPFLEVADVRWTQTFANLWHEDGRRRVTVFADLDEAETNARQILDFLKTSFLTEVVVDYDNMTYAFGGDRERMDESLASLWDGFFIAVIAIYAILAGTLRSYVQPIVIILALPFGFIGVVAGHVLMGIDVTLMSYFGSVTLAGIVVNDSLVLVDTINWSLREGKTVREAVFSAGEQRFRAVVLTCVTDVVGLAPLLLERSSHAVAVAPMAVTITFGLLFAAVLTLLIVPSVFLLVNDLRRFVHWLLYGGPYPVPELVEDAAHDELLAVK